MIAIAFQLNLSVMVLDIDTSFMNDWWWAFEKTDYNIMGRCEGQGINGGFYRILPTDSSREFLVDWLSLRHNHAGQGYHDQAAFATLIGRYVLPYP
jgi:hypothetical protein